ncbi:MAG: threonine ammonia-lyase [Propionibacteriaceae bacterium]
MSTPTPSVTLDDIRAARQVQSDVVITTPMEYSRAVTLVAGTDTWLKCENMQRAGSFKIRGAFTRMSRLTDAEKARGVVCASAGNHAQGVALAGQLLGIAVTVFMPVGAPIPKLLATRGYGAEVRQVGNFLDESLVAAREFEVETEAVLIHPFDHADIVAGQGSCGLEILEQVPDVKTIVVGTGGGGLIAGIATAVKALKPDVRVVGVQAEQAAAYPGSLAAGHPVPVSDMSTMADGIAVGCPGEVPYTIVSELVDAIETVSEASLSQALLFLLERAKLVVEPAGAASVAHLMEAGAGAYEGPVVAVLSGGNIDPLLLLRIIRYGLVSAQRYLQFRVRVPDSPGSLAKLLDALADDDANVIEVAHVRTGAALHVDEVEISLQLETKGSEHTERLIADLRADGYELIFD